MIYYIYKINFLCGEPGRYYIGKHEARNWNRADIYTGSGTFCKKYFKKYGKEGTYEKEILNFADSKEELLEFEKLYIGDLYLNDSSCMNLIPGGTNTGSHTGERHYTKKPGVPKGYKHTEETRKRQSEARIGKEPWNKGKHGVQEPTCKGRVYTEEMKQKQRDSHKGQCTSLGKHWKLIDGKHVYY